MAAETERFMGFVQRRNVEIPRLIEDGMVYMPPDEKKVKVVSVLCRVFISGTFLEGESNLESAIKISEGSPLVASGNHLSDADHSAKRYTLERSGYRDLADRFVYPAGLKMRERKSTAILFPAEHVVMVATPFDVKEASRVFDALQPDDNRRGILVDYRQNLQSLNEEAQRILQELVRRGKIPSVYPEATRSRTGFLQRALRETGVYFTSKEGWVLPVVCKGIEKLFAPEQYVKPGRVGVHVIVGEPYPVREILNRYRQVWRNPDINLVDFVMAKMAMVDPTIVSAEDFGFYSRLLAETN